MPNSPQTKATLVVDKTTGAITAPVSAATFKSANSLGGGAPDAHASTHAAAGSDPVTLAESQVTGLTAALAAKAAAADLTSHTGNVSNPHSVTKAQVGLTNADNTSDAAKPVSTATQTALDLKAAATHAHAATDITSGVVNADRLASGSALQLFRRNAANNAIECATISPGTGDLLAANNLSDLANAATARTNLALGNVTNTSDANKPVSTATQTALDLKAAAADLSSHTGNTSNPHSVTKAQVGLTNVTDHTQLKASDLDTDGTLAANSDTKIPSQQAVKEYVDANAGGGTGTDYILIRDEKAQGTQGGTFTSGAWRTRDLNTEAADAGSHASVASNQITLAAGTYRIRAIVPSYGVGYHKAKLYNITDSADVSGCMSTTSYGFTSGNTSTSYVFINGRFTIVGTKVFEIQHRSELTVATFGFGSAANITGAVEVYAVVELERES